MTERLHQAASARDARPREQQRHVRQLRVQVGTVAHAAVLHELLTMVGRDHDERVAREPQRAQGLQELAQLVVEVPDLAVIERRGAIGRQKRCGLPSRRRLRKEMRVALRGGVGIVDLIGVDEQEEAPIAVTLQPPQGVAKRLLHDAHGRGIVVALVLDVRVEAAPESAFDREGSVLGDGRRLEAFASQRLRQGHHLGR
jgi:hypothetical protein